MKNAIWFMHKLSLRCVYIFVKASAIIFVGKFQPRMFTSVYIMQYFILANKIIFVSIC